MIKLGFRILKVRDLKPGMCVLSPNLDRLLTAQRVVVESTFVHIKFFGYKRMVAMYAADEINLVVIR